MNAKLYGALFGLALGFVTPAKADYLVNQGTQTTIKSGTLSGGILPWMQLVDGAGTALGTAANPLAFTLNSTPSLANGNGVVPTQGGAVLSATNGMFNNLLQGNAALSATNGLYANILQGNAALSQTNPGFAAVTDGTNKAAVKAASTAPATTDPALVVATSPNSGVNVTSTDCSGTIASGSVAQSAITAQTTLHGFTIANIDASAGSGEPLWISFTTTAAASTVASYPLAAPTATTFAGLNSFTTPLGFGTNHAVSVIGATTGHKFSCTFW